MKNAVPQVIQAIQQNYNIPDKYLNERIVVKPTATDTKLEAGISLVVKPTPLYAFSPKQTASGVSVVIGKGKPQHFPSAFVATMQSGHLGVFSRGRYTGGVWKKQDDLPKGVGPGKQKATSRGNYSPRAAITERMTTSAFNMALRDEAAEHVEQFISTEAPVLLEQLLQKELAKITKK